LNNFHLSRGDLPEIAHSPVSRRPDLPADHGANQTKRPGAEHRAKSGCRVFVLRTGCVTGRSRSRDKKPPPARKVPTLPNPTPPQGECAKKKKARRAWHTPGQYKGGTYRLRQDELRILGATPPSRRSPQSRPARKVPIGSEPFAVLRRCRMGGQARWTSRSWSSLCLVLARQRQAPRSRPSSWCWSAKPADKPIAMGLGLLSRPRGLNRTELQSQRPSANNEKAPPREAAHVAKRKARRCRPVADLQHHESGGSLTQWPAVRRDARRATQEEARR